MRADYAPGATRTLAGVTRDPLHRAPILARPRVRVNVHAHAGVEVVLPARAPSARRGGRARAAPVDRAPPRRGARGARARGCARRHAAVSGRPLSSWRSRAHARAPPTASACSCPRATPRPAIERFYRRAARAEIAPRLDRADGARRHVPTATCRSARSARAGRRARPTGQHELQLAPAARARARARLRRLARGLPPGDPRPLAALLGAARAPVARLPRGPRVAAASTARRWCSSRAASIGT